LVLFPRPLAAVADHERFAEAVLLLSLFLRELLGTSRNLSLLLVFFPRPLAPVADDQRFAKAVLLLSLLLRHALLFLYGVALRPPTAR